MILGVKDQDRTDRTEYTASLDIHELYVHIIFIYILFHHLCMALRSYDIFKLQRTSMANMLVTYHFAW